MAPNPPVFTRVHLSSIGTTGPEAGKSQLQMLEINIGSNFISVATTKPVQFGITSSIILPWQLYHNGREIPIKKCQL